MGLLPCKDRGRMKGKTVMGTKARDNGLRAGRQVCCVWEKNLKPFDVKMVKVKGIRGSGMSGGLAEVELENGMSFRWSRAKTRHLYQDRARLSGTLEAPTRANVLIFTHGEEAQRYLMDRGYKCLCEGMDFSKTEETNDDKEG